MMIHLNRILSAEEVRTLYGFPSELFAKIQPSLPVLCGGDNGEPRYLESVVDEFLKQWARSLGSTRPEPGRPDTTSDIATFVDELKTKGRSWKECFAECKRKWPDDLRVISREQVRDHWRRHYGDKRQRLA